MSMITCPRCGRKISDKAVKCPGCFKVFDTQRKCIECGEMYDAKEEACPKCGCPSNYTFSANKVVLQLVGLLVLGIIFVWIFTFVFNFLSKPVKTSEMQTVPIFSEEK